MNKKVIIIVLSVILVILLSALGINNYLASNTELYYGTIPDDSIPEKFDGVTYTLPMIDEVGNESTKTFTVAHDEVEGGQIIKLYIRNEEVKKYEFIQRKDLPKNIKGKLP